MRRKQGFQQGKGAFISYYVYCAEVDGLKILRSSSTFPSVVSLWYLGDPVGVQCGVYGLCWRRVWEDPLWSVGGAPSFTQLRVVWVSGFPNHYVVPPALPSELRVKLERVPGVSLPLGMLPKSSVKALLLVDQNTGIIAPSMWTCSQRIQMAPNWNQFREGLIIFQWCENVVPKNIENSVGVLGK